MAEAERVVVEVLAKMDGFDGKVRQSANAFGGGMKQIENAAARAEGAVARSMTTVDRSFAQAAQRSRNLGYQISDIGSQLSVGTSPFVILAQQGPQVANALDGAKGAVGKFATFLSGPLGAAVLAATTILGGFLLKNKETADTVDDLVEKLKKKAAQDDLSARATDIFSKSLEGLELAARDARKAIKELEDGQKTQSQQTVESIQRSLAGARAIRHETAALLAAAEAQNEQNRGSLAGADPRFASQFNVSQDRIDALKKRLVDADKAAADLEASLTKALSFRAVEQGSRDSAKIINDDFDIIVEATRKRAEAEKKTTAELEKQVALLEKQREAALKTARERAKKPTDPSGQFTLADARGIVAGLGGTVTSTTGGKHVPNSYHYSGRAIDFVPKGGMASLTKDDIRRAFEQGGAKIVELLGPGDKGHSDHFHVAFAKGRRSPEDINAANERAANAEAARQQRQTDILGSLQERYAAALAELAEGTEESADARKAAIETERVNLNAKLDADKKLDPEIRAEAKRLNDATAKLTKEIIDRADAERQIRIQQENRDRDLTVAEALSQQQQDALQLQAGLARTQAERRDIELRILDLAIEEERLRARAVIAARDALQAELAKKGVDKLTDADRRALADANARATIAQGTLDALPGRQSAQRAGIMQQTAGPLEQLMQSVPQSAQEISEAFEAIAAHGLDSLSDAITDVITGSKSLGEAFRGVAQSIIRDIIAMTVKMLVFRAISSAFGFSGGGAVSGSSVASGANIVGGAVAKAGGGAIFGPGTGTSDSIPAWLSNGEFVMKARAVKKLGLPFLNALNDGKMPRFSEGGLVRSLGPLNGRASAAMTGITVVQQFTLDARHGITTPELLRSVNTIASQKAGQAGKAAFDASQKAMPERLNRFQKLGK